MYNHSNNSNQFSRIETTCSLLLTELKKIWSEVGVADAERDKLVYEIEQECVEVYRRKVIAANKRRSELQQSIALAESEIENIRSVLGEEPVKSEEEKVRVSLREEHGAIVPRVEEMRNKKEERRKLFVEVVQKLQKVSSEIFGSTEGVIMDGTDLSMKKLDGLEKRLLELENNKSNRLKQIVDHVEGLKSICGVLGMDFKQTIHDIHPSLDDSQGVKDLTDDTIKKLTAEIQRLREVKIQRMQKLRVLATTLVELWNLMDTPMEEQRMFDNVTSKIAASESEISEPKTLSMDFINHVEEEVSRLEKLKSSKVKELVLKKRLELEEICWNTHLVLEAHTAAKYSTEAVASGKYKLKCAPSTTNITVPDENRYSYGRGAHLTLKRAEKARVMVNKIPAMVEALTSKTMAWEKERGISFFYDGGRLLSRLEQYSSLKQEKEQERIRQRDQKKLQVQLTAEQEALFGSKPSPSQSGRKPSRTSVGVAINQKLSLGGAMVPNYRSGKTSPFVNPNKKGNVLDRCSYLRYGQHGGFASQSGRRNSEIVGHLGKKRHATSAAKACKNESSLVRKPLSPVSLSMSSRANIVNFMEDQKSSQNGTLKTMPPHNKTPMDTPSKSVAAVDDENRNPNTLPVPVASTPPTTSVPMLTALTPATPCVSGAPKTARKILEREDHSFEELRAGFVRPRPQS
ncbi:65-kDa microtubule-associated protein 9-like [Populus alba x Populus x berolinensis]|nr:65-kDa microtubule-associated protein 9-like [Populus alba x Populus x berolinensis]